MFSNVCETCNFKTQPKLIEGAFKMLSAFLKKGLKISKKPLVKRSSLFVPVQKESSSDPNIVASHQLMVQNGLISQVNKFYL